MPEFSTENGVRTWPSSESVNVAGSSGCSGSGSSNGGSAVHSPCSPMCLSPISTSPTNTLKKRRIRRVTSTGQIITEPFEIHSDHRELSRSRSQSPIPLLPEEDSISVLAGIIGWYPCFLLRIIKSVIVGIVPLAWRQILCAIPMLYISVWIWFFWQIVQFPITIIKFFLSLILTSPREKFRKKRTVLISGGSTIQALHLARNFYSAGARVVVCEVEGLFALARFSTAVTKFYTVPKPTSDQQQHYVRALCEIVEKEEASYYIPVSSTTSAYYDAVAKPHLELLGCSCFCPGIKEVWALDDILEVLKRCEKLNIPTPLYHEIQSKEEVIKLYERGDLLDGKYIMSTVGPSGLRERNKMVLPVSRNELKLPFEISKVKPWVVVQDVEGEHFLTCTTVKDSQVVANVTCRYDKESNGLIPIESKEIAQWLNIFFSKIHLLRPITGHISFKFVKTKNNNSILPLSSRVGVSLPYICYTSVHPRLLWKPCKHFSRQNSGPLVCDSGRYCMPDAFMSTLRNPSVEAVTNLIGTVLDKREALFAIWDPLPYCAYYHMQLPFKNVIGFVQRQQDRFPQPVAAPIS
ncbi:uncharacterized protein LOC108737221 [Agrilus planipennis]|uniref:Uncharacterized protein LOC108737221 n=1 Tax=Agrilus planipennis TaxID=224129 RepID=A0A1W4WZ72_AGRPL|nr:uncharacterized protein LOC108737221 [Agrilus planipennis]